MRRRLCVSVPILILLATNAYGTVLDNATILAWADAKDISEIRKVSPLILMGGEEAYLAEVYFDRGRNFQAGGILVRPKLREAREINIINSEYTIHNFKGLDFSYLEVRNVASGQGSVEEHRSLIYFNGWRPIIKKRTSGGAEGENCGDDDHDRLCYKRTVVWKFIEVESGVTVLRETIEIDKYSKNIGGHGYRGNEKPSVSVSTYEYIIHGKDIKRTNK